MRKNGVTSVELTPTEELILRHIGIVDDQTTRKLAAGEKYVGCRLYRSRAGKAWHVHDASQRVDGEVGRLEREGLIVLKPECCARPDCLDTATRFFLTDHGREVLAAIDGA